MSTGLYNLLERLDKADVDFVIIGGFAGVIHGCTVVTQDLDICCDFTTDNLLRLQAAIADLNPVYRMTPQKTKLDLNEQKCRGLKNLYLDTDLGQLDCISFVQGVGNFQKVKALSDTVKVENIRCCVLNIDAIIQSKKALNRQSDGRALRELESIKKLKDKKQSEETQ